MNRLFVVAMLFATSAFAQQQPIAPDACLDKLPEKAFTRVPVFLEAGADPSSRDLLPSIDLFAQSVAFKVRDLVGFDGSNLPEADSLVDWRQVWGVLELTARRDAPLAWQTPSWSAGADTAARSALSMVARAVKEVVASGEGIPFPDGFQGDRIDFTLAVVNPMVAKGGKIIPLPARQPVPLFTLKVPWMNAARMEAFPRIDYDDIHGNLSGATVTLGFAIDRNGKVDVSSIQEVVPPGFKPPSGVDPGTYASFVRAVKRGLPTGKFTASIVGGCAVRRTVIQRFDAGPH